MPYPTFEQYNNAFQAHQMLLADPELQRGVVATSGMGTPLAISGGFALTYTIKTGSKRYAVRCFHRDSKELQRRYQAIARRLAQLHSPYFLEFEFQPNGIRVNGGAYPIVKMAWAQGVTLGEFLEDNHGKKGAFSRLPGSLLALSKYLESERVAHGDIQTGNMMVSGLSSTIQLIDYDGMFVEEIRDIGSSELGHVNFQHPQRKSRNPFGPTMDRFSLIALSLAIKALNDDATLWQKTNSDMDAIVFRAADFVNPASSAVFSQLIVKPAIAKQAQDFASICQASIEKTPSLDDFLAGRNIPAAVVQLRTTPQEALTTSGYLGVYDVLAATSYEACLNRVGDKVEVVGRIVEIKENKARNGKPYIFINFGDWRGQIFKVSIWSEGLGAISSKPDASWVGKWVSVVGLMEPPYTSKRYKYSHLSIVVTANGQMSAITEAEAALRLASGSSKKLRLGPSNTEILSGIAARNTLSPTRHSPSVPLSPKPSGPMSSNKTVLKTIRMAQKNAAPVSTTTYTPPSRFSQPQPQPRPPTQPPPPEKGLVAKLFSWLFR